MGLFFCLQTCTYRFEIKYKHKKMIVQHINHCCMKPNECEIGNESKDVLTIYKKINKFFVSIHHVYTCIQITKVWIVKTIFCFSFIFCLRDSLFCLQQQIVSQKTQLKTARWKKIYIYINQCGIFLLSLDKMLKHSKWSTIQCI